MRILLVNQLFKMQGGTETIAINTYNMLKENGHEVFFFATDEGEYYEKNYPYAKYFPHSVYSVKEYLKNPIAYYWNKNAATLFSQMIDEVKPDIIHIHSLISPSILQVCKDKNIPTVMTLHMMPSVCPSTTFLYKNKYICNDFKCRNGNYLNCLLNKCRDNSLEASFRKTILSYVFDKTNVYSAVSYFICPSDAMRRYVSMTNICEDKSKIVTVNNFLTDDELKTIPNYSNKGYFLYLGRLSEEKGVHYLLQALKDLPRDIRLRIVGTGNQEKFLKQYTKENNLYNVEFLGFKNREEIKAEYQNCIVTILSCNCFENFPTTNMESFINGKPVIASNIGGIPEQVEHNKTGLLFEPANIKQLKECILKYWNNTDLVVEHGQNAYEKAHILYTEERYYKELMKVYEEILERK